MTETQKPRKSIAVTLWLIVLSVLLLVSLGANAYTLYLLSLARDQVAATLSTARTALGEMQTQAFSTEVTINQSVPISATLPFNHVFNVPINTVYPLVTTVETYVQIPLLGRQNIAIPIEADIPVALTLDIPVQTSLPISFSYHLSMTVPVEVTLPLGSLTPVEQFLQEAENALK